MTIATRPFDVRNYLQTPEDRREYLSQVFADGDLNELTDAVMLVADASGRADIAEQAREAGQGTPQLSDVRAWLLALGWRLQVGAAEPRAQAA